MTLLPGPGNVVFSDTFFARGDANSDGQVDISDPISLLNFLFLDGTAPSCEDAADANDDGGLDLSDAVFTLLYLYVDKVMPAPSPRCGTDPTPDALADCVYDGGLCPTQAPSISNLEVLPGDTVPLLMVGEQYQLTVVFDFEDLDADIVALHVTFEKPGEDPLVTTREFLPNETAGKYLETVVVDSAFSAGPYEIRFELEDAEGSQSDTAVAAFTVSETAPPTLAITDISSTTGVVGEEVVLQGIGFGEEEESEVRVTFAGGASAEVISRTDTELTIVVPEGSLSGPIAVEAGSGRTQSPVPFTVLPEISLTPRIATLVTGQATEFRYTTSGSLPTDIVWSVNGSEVPPFSLGTLEPALGTCVYTAPEVVPLQKSVLLRCASADAPDTVFDELEIEILEPAPPAGTAKISGAEGGEAQSVRGDVQVVIPPGAHPVDTTISVERLEPASLPPSDPDRIILAAARLEPPGMAFSKPVTVSISLQSPEPPGTELPIYFLDGDELADSGAVAVVDDSGVLATGQVQHFSTLILVREMTRGYTKAASNSFIPAGGFHVKIHPDVAGAGGTAPEGLRVPLMVTHTGLESKFGPFFPGVTVKAETTDGVNIPVVGTQPSGDAWRMGVVLEIPVLPDCGQGETLSAVLKISHDHPEVSSAIMELHFEIECLCELIINDQTITGDSLCGLDVRNLGGERTVEVLPGRTYRFSEMRVESGHVLRVVSRSASGALLVDPAVIEVTGDVTIAGTLRTKAWFNAYIQRGRIGEGNHDGGDGGPGGVYNAGSGGKGAPIYLGVMCVEAPPLPFPICGDAYSHSGQAGFASLTGSPGGAGGQRWDQGTWWGFVFDLADYVVSGATGDILGAFQAGQDLAEEDSKIYYNDVNQLKSAGRGGGAPPRHTEQDYELAFFKPPLAGGGGGGSGLQYVECSLLGIDFCKDHAGGGGGGGGGGAPGLKLVAAGNVLIEEGGLIDGTGGNGGPGGNGAGDETAPGGGGGGGNGAQIHIITNTFTNNGTIIAPGGFGGSSGYFEKDGEYVFVSSGFGRKGQDGIVRVDGTFRGNHPELSWFYNGPRFRQGGLLSGGAPSWVFLGEYISPWVPGGAYYYSVIVNDLEYPLQHYKSPEQGRVNVELPPYELEEGFNTISFRVNRDRYGIPEERREDGPFITMHPWQRRHVCYFPGTGDGDQDGLTQTMEEALGTDSRNSDTDGDLISDGEEYFAGTDPTVADRYRLFISHTPGGTVTLSPASTEPPWYPAGSEVTVTAVPDVADGYTLRTWDGDRSGTENPLTILMDRDVQVRAVFLKTVDPGEPGTWYPPITLNELDRSGTPTLAMNPDGDAVIVWIRGELLAKRFSKTSGWSGKESVGSGPYAKVPHVVMNASRQAMAVWREEDLDDWRVLASRFVPGSGWGSVSQLAGEAVRWSTDRPALPTVAMDSLGSAVAVWNRPIDDFHYGRRFLPASGWGAEQKLDAFDRWDPKAPSVLMTPSGTLRIIWGDLSRAYERLGDMKTWGAAVEIGNAGATSMRPAADMNAAGQAIVAWHTSSAGEQTVEAIRYEPGSGWSAPATLHTWTEGWLDEKPRVALDADGSATVVWCVENEVWGSRFDATSGWQGAVLIQHAGDDECTDPKVAADGSGNAMALWQQGFDLWYAHYRNDTGWGVAKTVEDTENRVTAGQVAMDTAGNAMVVWEEQRWRPSLNRWTAEDIQIRRFSIDRGDTDGDGFTDDYEVAFLGTNPALADTDGDGLDDNEEVAVVTDPNNPDSDGDQLSDEEEVDVWGTDPLNGDSDGDSILDGKEVHLHGTNPAMFDTDDDGLSDYVELYNYGTDPLQRDTDRDFLSDDEEVSTHHTDPNKVDTDDDGLTDSSEVEIYETDPLTSDTDGDRLSDSEEILAYGTDPTLRDTDGDTFGDAMEVWAHTNPLDPDDRPWTGQGLTILDFPGAEFDARFGVAVDILPDIDGDGKNDYLVGAPGKDVGGDEDVGAVYLFSNSGDLIYTFNHPEPQAGAQFGYAITHVGSDVSAIIISAPYHDTSGEGGPAPDGGRAFAFYHKGGPDQWEVSNQWLGSNDPRPDGRFGISLDAGKDRTTSEYHDIYDLAGVVVGEAYPGDYGLLNLYSCVIRPDNSYLQAEATFFEPNTEVGSLFGYSVDIQFNSFWDDHPTQAPIDFCRIHISAPGKSHQGRTATGVVYTYHALSLMRQGGPGCRFRNSTPMENLIAVDQEGAFTGGSVSSIDTITPLGNADLRVAIGAKGYNGTLTDQGQLINRVTDGTSLVVENPYLLEGARFGECVERFKFAEGAGDLVAAGAPGQKDDEGQVFICLAGHSICVDTMKSPNPESGAQFGVSLSGSAAGMVAVGAPWEDVEGNADQGRVYLYAMPERDADGDQLYLGMELLLGTDPDNQDSDGDTWPDGIEWQSRTDPRDPDSHPDGE